MGLMSSPSYQENPHEEQRILKYEVLYYDCPKVEFGECYQTEPGNGRLESVDYNLSDLQTYLDVFEKAKIGAPLCPIHKVPMTPQLQRK